MMNLLEAFESGSKGFFADLKCDEVCVDDAFEMACSPDDVLQILFNEKECCGVADYVEIEIEQYSVDPINEANMVSCFVNQENKVSCLGGEEDNTLNLES